MALHLTAQSLKFELNYSRIIGNQRLNSFKAFKMSWPNHKNLGNYFFAENSLDEQAFGCLQFILNRYHIKETLKPIRVQLMPLGFGRIRANIYVFIKCGSFKTLKLAKSLNYYYSIL